ncbi:MAG: hypothetical protein HYX91_05980 [Chloroflexi bacterium]|nr:hypothetical protein [Chloroflexota bacterium]
MIGGLGDISLVWPLILLIALWEVFWKGMAMWRAGRNGHLKWFIAILVLNTAGILPVVYWVFFSKPREPLLY